jgi:hypothetical protein
MLGDDVAPALLSTNSYTKFPDLLSTPFWLTETATLPDRIEGTTHERRLDVINKALLL